MKKFSLVLTVCLLFSLLCIAANADTFNGTMVRSNTADPNLFFHNGKYYLTQTGTSRIAVFETNNLEELKSQTLTANIEYIAYYNGRVYDPSVTELFGEGATINGTWSPEIHYFSADDFPGHPEYEGWYMFVGLRKTYIVNGKENSSYVRLVVLKSTSGTPKGPYGHPTTGVLNHSQPVLNSAGKIHDEWACGQTILRIPEGEYAGLYGMWVSEEGRGSPSGGKYGDFYQKIMIAKMQSPWQFSSDIGIVTTPTQSWEYAGASTSHPRVVEGATPVYGKNGEVFITYSGSGYWSDYGLGQLTWTGGNPLLTDSWVKYENNPIFTAKTATNLRGAGHAAFLTDTTGNGFLCYHAYKYTNGTKASSRDAYIETYYIDYTASNGVGYGVVRPGVNKNGVAADHTTVVTFNTSGNTLAKPSISIQPSASIKLTFSSLYADGFIIYRSTDGNVFEYLATTTSTTYTDQAVEGGKTYYYRAYAYREEEISTVSATVSGTALNIPTPTLSAAVGAPGVTLTVAANGTYGGIRLYRSTNGTSFTMIHDTAASGATAFADANVVYGTTYYYYAVAYDAKGNLGNPSPRITVLFNYLPSIGDVNSDEVVSFADVLRLMRYVSGEDVNIDLSVADYNLDGSVTLADAIALLVDVLR